MGQVGSRTWSRRRGPAWRAVAATLAVIVSLLVVPAVGGTAQFIDLRGGTPAAPAAGYQVDPAGVGYIGTREIRASAATRQGIYARVPVGGISGIDCAADRCLAVSDDPGQRGPVRAYPLEVSTGEVGAPIVLTDVDGVPYRPGTVDPESIRVTGSGQDTTVVWTAEGTPAVTVADGNGRARHTLPVPEGIRRNQGLEGLAVDSSGRIITATEAAPDGRDHPVITVYAGSVGSAGAFNSAGSAGTPGSVGSAETADSAGSAGSAEVAGDDGNPGSMVCHRWPGTGVSEILSDPSDGSLLVLERGYTPGVGNSAVIWRTWLNGAETGGSGGCGVLARRLVVDLGALLGQDVVGNTEAMAWAPGRPGHLLIGTDDNFRAGQRGVLHEIALPTR